VLVFPLLPPVFSDTSEEESTSSNITVSKSVAISKSDNLTAGIQFGGLDYSGDMAIDKYDIGCSSNGCDPGTNNVNASANFNYTNVNMNGTNYWIKVDTTTNSGIDLCLKANAALAAGGNTIALTNYHYSNATSSTNTTPTYPASTDMTTSYVYVFSDVAPDTSNERLLYFRFNLNIPSNAVAGTYNNTIYFKATENSSSC
jgi:hypothetical protein